MLDSFRNLLMAGLGAALITRDKVLEVAQKWVDKGSMTASEAENLADEIMEESKRQARSLGQSIEEAVRSVMKNMELAKASQLEDLEGRVAALEDRLSQPSPEQPVAPSQDSSTSQPGPAPDQMPEES
jgi:polyhydroxyalkanoate synthesis regulator phasin